MKSIIGKRQFLSIMLVALTVASLTSCSVKQMSIYQEMPTMFTLSGQWVVTNDDELMDEVMFDFRPTSTNGYELKVHGQEAELDHLRSNKDQFIFTYITKEKKRFTVLASVLEEDQIKFSTVTDPVFDFQPVAKLGEKVVYLKKRNQGDLKLITKAIKD